MNGGYGRGFNFVSSTRKYNENLSDEIRNATEDVEGNKLKKGYEFVNNQYGDIVQRKKATKGKYRRRQLRAGAKITEDPDDIYARMTRMEFNDYVKNYREFEEEQLEKAQTDTSLIDQARTDAESAPALMQGIQQRNMERYGASLTPAQQQAMAAASKSSSNLNTAQTMSNARIAQREQNQGLLAQLIDIGQGVNRTAQDQMGGAAADATQRKNAYTQARAQAKAQTYSTLGSLGGMGAAFLMGF